ncbi:hypothetical protein [Actinokineospora sp.]|uniref:hypothetical protein n=1 Tax=Actinokineospora sp. TaxID=1872133 RepID=UPI0040383D70
MAVVKINAMEAPVESGPKLEQRLGAVNCKSVGTGSSVLEFEVVQSAGPRAAE